jgi:5-methylcytosine-specific restriction endonuclease McrA
MAKKRYIKKPKVETGRCTWCKELVYGRRRKWCSDQCVHEYRIRSSPGYIRKIIYARDRGICAECAIDTKPVKTKIEILRKAVVSQFFPKKETEILWDLLERYGHKPKTRTQKYLRSRVRSLWEVDHILPVKEGGGGCDERNLQTLCRPCHLRKTKLMRAK